MKRGNDGRYTKIKILITNSILSLIGSMKVTTRDKLMISFQELSRRSSRSTKLRIWIYNLWTWNRMTRDRVGKLTYTIIQKTMRFQFVTQTFTLPWISLRDVGVKTFTEETRRRK